ncbi:MAG: cupin domain-containing protein [Candidatus Micrarchaeota archaeon]
MARKGFADDLEKITLENADFRRVLYTATHSQLVLMSIPPGGQIGAETHEEHDQFFRFEQGEGLVTIDGNAYAVKDGSGVIVPAGALHNVQNTGKTDLRLYTIYSPPEHADGTVHKTKAEATAQEEHFDGKTTE